MSELKGFKIKDGVLVKYMRKGGDVVIPDCVTSIGEYAFYDCKSLTSVVIPNGVRSIGEGAFHGCGKLTTIEIPNSVESIGCDAFCYCNSSMYNEKDGLNYLGNEDNKYLYLAETTNKKITTASVDSNCKFIGSYAFRDCGQLIDIVIPDSVTTIGNSAFCWCCALTSVVIPNGVTSIGPFAFYCCKSLTSVVIPNGVRSIGLSAFYSCESLTSVVIPNSVESIERYAFCGCSSLMYNEKDGLNYLGNEDNKYLYLAETTNKKITTASVDSNCKFIGCDAFRDCGQLTSIVIPSSITSIGDNAFYGCDGLKRVYYKGTVSDWKGITFGDCNTKLKKATRFYYMETKSDIKANHWHYDENGKIVIW